MLKTEVLIVTCSEPDGLPFLRSLPPEDVAQITLVSTSDVVRSAERQTPVATSFVISGVGAVSDVRRLIGPRRKVVVVVAPDPWGPLKGKGFVRARLLAPLFLHAGDRADLLELDKGGQANRSVSNLGRAELARRLYVREASLLGQYALYAGLGRPAGRLASTMGQPAGRMATLLAVPRALAGALLATPTAAVTLCRELPFILRTEARARFRPPPR